MALCVVNLCSNPHCVILNPFNRLNDGRSCLKIEHLDKAIRLIKRWTHQYLHIFDITIVFYVGDDLMDKSDLILIKCAVIYELRECGHSAVMVKLGDLENGLNEYSDE